MRQSRSASKYFACLPSDQRDVKRPQDGNLDGNPQGDIGAFELTPSDAYLPVVR